MRAWQYFIPASSGLDNAGEPPRPRETENILVLISCLSLSLSLVSINVALQTKGNIVLNSRAPVTAATKFNI